MYPRNAASPERVSIGAVVQISDGAVQTSGVTVRILPFGGSEADGGGTTAYSTDGVVVYTPTQAETNYTSFILIAKKTGCIPASVTVVTSESSVSGRVYVQTNGDKTGYKLASDGLALVTAPIANAVWDEVLTGATHNIASSAGRRLRQLASVIVRAGTAQGPGTGNNQIQLDAGASATNGDYDPGLIFIETGTGAGQARLILHYNGSTKVATVDRDWRVNPDNTSEFVILADAGRNSVNEGLAQGGTSTTITLNASASASDDAYNGQLVFIRSGTGQDQVGLVEDYVGSTKVATIRTRSATGQWATVPDTTSAYMMIPNLTFTVSEIQSGLATSTALAAVATNVTALVNRIPATLFAGITSLANWLGAIAGKTADSTTRSQINATAAGASFNETTDSLEAIRDRGDDAWGTGTGQGTGARIVTITVRDSSANPVEAATVRMYRAGETYAGVTNASGVTSFSLDDATFTVAITATGFSFTPVSLVVSGNVSQTYTLTSTGGVTPSVTPRTTGFWTCLSALGVAEPGAQVTIQASSPPSGSTGLVMEDAPRTATADNQGVVQFSNLTKGATYIVYRTGSSRKYNVVVPANAGDSIALGSIVG